LILTIFRALLSSQKSFISFPKILNFFLTRKTGKFFESKRERKKKSKEKYFQKDIDIDIEFEYF